MKILLISHNIYHHMIPFANGLVNQVGVDNFRFAVLDPPEEFRLKMGFSSDDSKQPWTILLYEQKVDFTEYKKWFEESDVVLFNSRGIFNLAKRRLSQGKLTFYFSERWWKPEIGRWRLLHPRYIKYSLLIRQLSKNPVFYYLAQGGYAENDIRFITKFEDRIWRFGYFTDVTENVSENTENAIVKILWCGRMIKWKNVDVLIKAFSILIKCNPNCFLTLIGDGDEKANLFNLAKKYLPNNSYMFLPSQPVNIIRMKMNEADIYVMPSSGEEGWGAVVNEAMAEGCAVIATEDSGAGKSVIQHGINGMLFKSGDWKSLYNMLELLVQNEIIRTNLQVNGKKDISENWSPELAAKRFISKCRAILNGYESPLFQKGPFSGP